MSKEKPKKNRKHLKKSIVGWLIALPTLILFGFFVWYPLFKNILISFFENYEMTKFVGFGNYGAIFKDTYFISAFTNTFKYILWSIIIGFFIPMIVGFLLSEVIHLKGFFRIVLYIPSMLSGIAVVFLFQNIYGDEAYSILNVIRKSMGLERMDFRSNASIVIPLIVVAMTWKGFGGTSLIYMSNFQDIDSDLYEASRIDGASPVQRFWKITMPLMRPTILTLLILQIISVFQVFYEPMIIAGATSKDAMTLMQLSYYYFTKNELSKSAATSIILALIIIIITVVYFLITRAFEKKWKKNK
ncbi:MAG: carbohydrate ABC transporter permease [Bacilli bacterium]|jgi:multiple sugar transport system permease protein